MEYPDFRLDDQVALVTGASRGIGFGLAKALAHAGAKVALAARSIEPLTELAQEIRAEGGEAEPFALDVSDVSRSTKPLSGSTNILGAWISWSTMPALGPIIQRWR